ncbi:Synaptobrevin family protein [Histomonas meleagridis]|uniref:Synaptobrevin family protein n=1 Tax=Histomonas meleagridis TaxID=135588 RepID=UPI00355A7ACA|nr:Synaptobrevin family protein [Histomonas meleagridis]KAH0805398.1 Synaptobrevin family protein [Histomonas meleagridis]
MQFEYAAVTRNSQILAQHANTAGNFDVYLSDIINRINPNDSRFTCEKMNHRYFISHESSGLNFIVAGPLTLQSQAAYNFLDQVQRNFIMKYGRTWESAPSYGMQSEFGPKLQSIMCDKNDKLSQIKDNLTQATETMSDNLQKAILRSNQIDSLDASAQSIAESSREFDRQSTQLKRRLCFEKYKYIILGIIIGVVILIIIIIISVKSGKKSKE